MAGRINQRYDHRGDHPKTVVLECFRGFLKKLLCFGITLGILILLLWISAFIPKAAIRENLLESAEKLDAKEDNFYYFIEDDPRTLVHNYADAITLNIMYSIDPEHKMTSLLAGPFYSDAGNPEYPMIQLLEQRVEQELEADTVYDRYWHGMILLLRPLFCVLTYFQIRVLYGILLLSFMAIVSVLLWKKKQKMLVAIWWLAALLVHLPMVVFCSEYMATWMIMFGLSVYVIVKVPDEHTMEYLMIISGVCCAFFDFLTTETITFVVPMMLYFCHRKQKGMLGTLVKEGFYIIKTGTLWVFSYLGTLFIKWILAGFVLQQNRILPAVRMMAERQGGDILASGGEILEGVETFPQALLALSCNVKLLAGVPKGISYSGVLIALFFAMALMVCFLYLYRRNDGLYTLSYLLFVLALIPVARIVLLNSHSVEHDFFTYRALFGTVLCLGMGIFDMVYKNKSNHMSKRKDA